LPAPISGNVGLWSKIDSVSEFADYVVTHALDAMRQGVVNILLGENSI
jgi:hypothetical protein